MGPFDYIQKKGSKALKPQPAQIRKEIISTHPHARKALSSKPKRTNTRTVPAADKTRQPDLASLHPSKSGKQGPKKRLFSAQFCLQSDSDDDTSEETLEASSKRSRVSASVEPASNRQVRCKKLFSEDEEDTRNMVHAAEIATLRRPTKYKAAFPNDPQATNILLHYPSELAEERYELVVPIQSDDFKPLEDIKEVLEIIATHYLPPTETSMLKDDSHGLLRKLKRSIDRRYGNDYVKLIEEWNDRIAMLSKDGTIGKVLDGLHSLDLRLIERILTQTYSRTVSLHVGLLRHYENGTDNVYGELLPKFISSILRRDTKMNSTHVFVDLGSGVGNVVLQAALEIGCESWGCEMMDNACDLAELQEKEFRARCRLWGVSAGSVRLERGDFLENVAIGKVLKTADVVLVNNQAFTPELNEGLISLFLDLKEGCQIVSLKSFVPSGHKITSRNLYRACNVLDVVEKRYYSACVSWTDAPGTYYVSTKDSSKVKLFANDM